MNNQPLTIIPDFLEEGWPSMELSAEMLHFHTPESIKLQPRFSRRVTRIPWLGRSRFAFNADRFLNRYVFLPRFVRHHRSRRGYFHVVDHSYSHLLHSLPRNRSGVFCHDLDTFRCLLEPKKDSRPRWFRLIVQQILRGLQLAAIVFHSTHFVREQIIRYGLVDDSRLVHAPYGVSPEFTHCDSFKSQIIQDPYLLHVGSCIPRKRIDVLLDVFAEAKIKIPKLRLIKVGGEWSTEQRQQIQRYNLQGFIDHQQGLSRIELSRLYHNAALVLQTSEAEGFGLPLIEALACGAIVVASDLTVFREVGGEAVVYCPVADVPAWVDTIVHLVSTPVKAPSLESRLVQASKFTWQQHAKTIVTAYQRLTE